MSENIEKKFWTEEEKYVEQIRAIELSREKLKYENESLREDVEALEGVREKLEERTREVEDLKIELDEVMQAKKEEKEMMKKLISEGKCPGKDRHTQNDFSPPNKGRLMFSAKFAGLDEPTNFHQKLKIRFCKLHILGKLQI